MPKISELPSVTTPASSDTVPLVHSGVTSRATVNKLLSALNGVFYVDAYGAVGDGVTDDSAALAAASAALSAAGGGVLEFRAGATYIVGGQTMNNPPINTYYTWPPNVYYPVELANCTKPVVIRGNGAKIKCRAGAKYGTFNTDGTPMATPPGYLGVGASTPYYYMIYAHGCTRGIAIEDLELDGNLNNISVAGNFSDTGIQLAMSGMNITNNSGPIVIRNVYTHHHGLDGYQVDGPSTGMPFTRENAVVEGVRSECNGRQGMSYVGGKGWTFISCSFNYVGRANAGSDAAGLVASNPGSGVDFEAEAGKEIRDVNFINCEFIGNYGSAIVADSGTNVDRITFRGCAFVGTTNYSLWPNRPGFVFEDCYIVGTANGASTYKGYTGGTDKVVITSAAQFIRCVFTDDVTLSPSGVTYNVNGHLFEGGVAYVEFHRCTWIKTKNTTGGAGNANQMRYVDNVFIARLGALLCFGRFDGSETHFIEDGGIIGVPNRFNTIAAKTNVGDALDSWYYTTVAANTPTTVRHNATMDRQTRDVLGTRTTAIDADFTLTQGTDTRTQILSGALTANRTITLSGGKIGSRFRIVRTGGGAFNWNVGGLKTLTAANQWCEVEHDGTSYKLVTNGTL